MGQSVLKGFRLPHSLVTRIQQYVQERQARQVLGRISLNEAVVHLLKRGLDAESQPMPRQDREAGQEHLLAVQVDVPDRRVSITTPGASNTMLQCLLHTKKGTKEIVPVLYPEGAKCRKCAGNASQRQTQQRKREEKAQAQAASEEAEGVSQGLISR
jgi:hypothetical protein